MENIINKITASILPASVLVDTIRELEESIPDDDEREVSDLIDYSELPSLSVEDLYHCVDVGYPIWTMDDNGDCMVGENTVESIGGIIDSYRGNWSGTPAVSCSTTCPQRSLCKFSDLTEG